DLTEPNPAIEYPQPAYIESEPGNEHRLRDAVEGRVTVQPGRKQLVRHRPENDREGLVGANLLCRHGKATSSSPTGLQFSTASSVSCSAPVSMASMATSFKRRKICEVMPPGHCHVA